MTAPPRGAGGLIVGTLVFCALVNGASTKVVKAINVKMSGYVERKNLSRVK